MSKSSSKRRTILLVGLGLLLAWALGLRLWMGTLEPDAGRFWDERYGLENIARLFDTGELRPANGYHPTLSYLPQAALLGASRGLARASGEERLEVYAGDGRFTPTGYVLARWLQALFGALTLWLAFRFGRRIASPEAALLGTFFLAVVPWHLRQSVIFKPDILLVATVLLALGWSVNALARPAIGRFARAGAGVGLALATKFNAGPVALPLVVLSLWQARRPGRRGPLLRGLAVAGAVALGLFLLLVPYLLVTPELYRSDFSRTLRDYARKGAEAEASRLDVLGHSVHSLLSEPFHGPLVGTLALVGLAGLLGLAAVPLLRPRSRRAPGREASPAERERRLGRAALLVFVGGYTILYAASTTNPSSHNWLPLVPMTSLAAAWLLVDGTRWLLGRLPDGRPRRAAGAAVVLLLAGLVAVQAVAASRYAWRQAVPTARAEAERVLLAQLGRLAREEGVPVEWRFVVRERAVGRLVVKHHRRRAAELAVPELGRLPGELPGFFSSSELLRGADAVVVCKTTEAPVPEGTDSGAVLPVVGPWTRQRGDPLAVHLHPWRPVGGPVTVELVSPEPGRYRFRLDRNAPTEALPGERISLLVHLPSRRGRPAAEVSLRLRGRAVPLFPVGRAAGADLYLTPRIDLLALGGGAPSHGVLAWQGRWTPRVELRRWAPAAAGSPTEAVE